MKGKTTRTIHVRPFSLHLHSGITKVECPRDSDGTEFCWDFFVFRFSVLISIKVRLMQEKKS
jgi:hypothetical protein